MMRFLQPETLREAIDLLSADSSSTTLIAGGATVVLMLQQKLITPEVLVSLARIPGLRGVREDGDRIHIGALTVHREVEESPLIRARYPALSHAASVVGNIRVRNQGTLGGNLG